jgi:pimeloyl-ACP methyl ester carboxylesterase
MRVRRGVWQSATLGLALTGCLSGGAQAAGLAQEAAGVPQAIWQDPPHRQDHPAGMEAFAVRSHGGTLNAIIYTAAGAGPHPTVLLLHGFPGNEQNLDLAQAIRRAGWNVVTFHYRGSWGSTGAFSFMNCTQDVSTILAWLRRPPESVANAIDGARIAIVGHSVGGMLAGYAAAHDGKLIGTAMISAADVPWRLDRPLGDRAKVLAERSKSLDQAMGASAGMTSLAGTTPRRLASEMLDHASELNFVRHAEAIGRKPLLLVTSDDGFTPGSDALANAIIAAGGAAPKQIHIATDHAYSDARIALTTTVLMWLESLPGAKSTQ